MIIGITGKIGSGKSTLTKYITENYNFEEYSFAGPLKKIGKIFGFKHKELYGSQAQKLGINKFWEISARKFLQIVGTELFRNNLQKLIPEMNTTGSVWIDLFLLELDKNPKNYVISDVRFLNEEKALRKLGAIIIKTQRNRNEKNQTSNHSSETEMDKIVPDFLIDNNKTRKSMFKKFDKIARKKRKQF